MAQPQGKHEVGDESFLKIILRTHEERFSTAKMASGKVRRSPTIPHDSLPFPTTPYPSLTTFDAPSREFCTVRRIRTNTPLQALVTLNDPVFVESAQGLARRMMKEGGASDADRVAYGFRLCLSRPPTQAEQERLLQLYRETYTRLKPTPEKAKQFIYDRAAG